ncbi:hypothetical protein [Gemmatimonas sp.]|uniref:hypothetical protein n=1 Tax=Gemmatimonas sp. TaxID=1962908 RepID=UPI0039832419
MRPSNCLPTLLLALLAACSGGDSAASDSIAPPTTIADGSFARIQRDILNVSCVSCHKTGDANARQSGLVLTADSSYQQLMGVPSRQRTANANGLPRIKAFRSDSSLFYHKLAWIPGHHSVDYGNLMPMGTVQGVTAGQLEYVRRWIEAGAPRSGHVADTLVLRDSRVQAATFTPLPAPTSAGLQFKVDSFAVTPLSERELFVNRRVGNATDLYITRIESRMRPGSHHLLLYSFDERNTAFPCNTRPTVDVVRDIRNRDGTLNLLNMLPMACHVYFAGAMTPDFDYRFPAGVALRLPANTSLDFNVHYVNRSPADLAGEAFANLYFTDRANIQTVARTLNYANQDIPLPPGRRTTHTKVFSMPTRTTILGLTSHMHALGEKFEIRMRRANGTESVVYVNTDWEHPGFVNFATPLVLEAGDALVSVVTWNNTTTRTVSFGLASSDEMNIIFGYAY